MFPLSSLAANTAPWTSPALTALDTDSELTMVPAPFRHVSPVNVNVAELSPNDRRRSPGHLPTHTLPAASTK